MKTGWAVLICYFAKFFEFINFSVQFRDSYFIGIKYIQVSRLGIPLRKKLGLEKVEPFFK